MSLSKVVDMSRSKVVVDMSRSKVVDMSRSKVVDISQVLYYEKCQLLYYLRDFLVRGALPELHINPNPKILDLNLNPKSKTTCDTSWSLVPSQNCTARRE